ncbi:HAD family hydrolase [Yinghuangia soli]|uniref:HAD-IA family hydrolase n=1 Tax=Yinghuangia soli TaxID=2908204 RepID=A0AA41Q3J1_9ACTN|nr:HAD-IA family hydrolase [Yinghuangia soli]MCF2529452.1 HAD-IA family hydrolase [Yinghuangia soli]
MTTELPYGAVLCDFDNVIRFYDPAPLKAVERDAGIAPGTTTRAAFLPELMTPVMLGAMDRQGWLDRILAALIAQDIPENTARTLTEAFARAPFKADPEVVGLLRTVRNRVPLVLVSNASLELEADLLSLGLDTLAHHVVSSARLGIAKPDRRIYEIAADLAGVDPRHCLFVDDLPENVAAAAALGMSGLLYRVPADLRSALQGGGRSRGAHGDPRDSG